MNRSFSHNFRPYTTSTSKKNTSRSVSKLQFRTVLKYRNTHEICQKGNVSIKSPTPSKKPDIVQEVVSAYETAGHQQMREFIRAMKVTTVGGQISTVADRGQGQKKKPQPVCQSSRSLTTQSIYQSQHGQKQEQRHKLVTSDYICNDDLCLQQMQKKIQQLIRIKLTRSGYSSISQRFGENQVDQELKILMDRVRKYNGSGTKRGNQIGNDIESISRKIGIIEKAIASNSTENQVLRKMYSSTKKVRKNYAKLSQQPESSKRPTSQQKFRMSSPPPLHYETTSSSHYVKPASSSYLAHSAKKVSYILNRQPLPRSLYQREFLFYGVVPTYSNNRSAIAKDNPSLKITKPAGLQGGDNRSIFCEKKLTMYQTQFKDKSARLTDSHQLDCRVDKFKNVNINFMPKKRGELIGSIFAAPEQPGPKKFKNKVKQHEGQAIKVPQSAHPSTTSQKDKENLGSSHIFIPKTQHQAQFKAPFGQNTEEILRKSATPLKFMVKQRNLNNLKYAYKCQFAV